MAMVAAGFAALLIPIPALQRGVGQFVPAILFAALPLLGLALVAPRHWTALFKPVTARDVGTALFFGRSGRLRCCDRHQDSHACAVLGGSHTLGHRRQRNGVVLTLFRTWRGRRAKSCQAISFENVGRGRRRCGHRSFLEQRVSHQGRTRRELIRIAAVGQHVIVWVLSFRAARLTLRVAPDKIAAQRVK